MKRMRVVIVSTFVFVVGGIIGTGGAAALGSLPHEGGFEPAPYETNAAGQTFGSNFGSSSPERDPDLILVIGDSGHEGYVRSIELNGSEPSSPEEAVRHQAQPGEVVSVLTVYESDGRTAIDTFTIVAGELE